MCEFKIFDNEPENYGKSVPGIVSGVVVIEILLDSLCNLLIKVCIKVTLATTANPLILFFVQCLYSCM